MVWLTDGPDFWDIAQAGNAPLARLRTPRGPFDTLYDPSLPVLTPPMLMASVGVTDPWLLSRGLDS